MGPGGLAADSSLLAAGGDLAGMAGLRRSARVTALELAADRRMRSSMGRAAGALATGTPGRLHRAATALTFAGAVGSVLVGRRNRAWGAACGLALSAGSVLTRFAIFQAGQESARDPAYTIIPQRDRLDRARHAWAGPGGRSAGPRPAYERALAALARLQDV